MSVGDTEAGSVVVAREFQRHTRLDASFLFDYAAALERRPDVFAHLRLDDSGCSHLVNGRLEVADFARTELQVTAAGFAAAFVPTALNETRAVALALRLCTGAATATSVAQRMSELLDASVDDCVGLLSELVRLGVLVTELRVPPVAERGAMLLETLERVAPDDARALASILELAARADAGELSASPDRYDAAASVARELVPAEPWWKLDSTRTFSGALGAGVTADLETVLGALAPLSRTVSSNAAIASAFVERYAAGREVPLLDVLDQDGGLDFERALASEVPETTTADSALLAFASSAIRDGLASVELDAQLSERLAQPRPPADYPQHVEALCHVGRSADGRDRVVLFTGAHAGAHVTLGRFYPDIVVEPVEEAPEPGTIVAELAILPHNRRSANVVGRRSGVEFEVICGVRATRPARRVVKLDDLVVGVYRERVYLRSLRHGTFVRVVQHDVATTAYVSRIAQFFEAIFAPDLRSIAFDWGNYAGTLPFTPRVTVRGIAVAPAIWRLPKNIAMRIESGEARAWCASWRVPRHLYVASGDNRLLLDREHPLCRSIVAREAARLENGEHLEFHEALPHFGDGLPGDGGEEYFAEVTVTFRCTFPEREPPPVPRFLPEGPTRTDRLRPLGSEWIYAKFYIGAPRTSYFLERSISRMLAELEPEIDLFHFVRYADPAHHVRVRFRARDSGSASRVRERAIRFVETLTSEGVVDGAVWDVYDREIERYGGLRSIETAERIFDIESRALLSALGVFRTSDDSLRDVLRDIADFAVALCGGERPALEAIRLSIGGRRDRLTPQQWATVRAARAAPRGSQYLAIAGLGDRLRETAESDTNEIAQATLHMHCNRLGLTPLEEVRALHLVAAIFEADIATLGSEHDPRKGTPLRTGDGAGTGGRRADTK